MHKLTTETKPRRHKTIYMSSEVIEYIKERAEINSRSFSSEIEHIIKQEKIKEEKKNND